MADANLVTELGNCKKSAHVIAAAMLSIFDDLTKVTNAPMPDKLTCDKTYPKAVLLANLLYEIEDMVINIINDTVEKIVEGVDDEG